MFNFAANPVEIMVQASVEFELTTGIDPRIPALLTLETDVRVSTSVIPEPTTLGLIGCCGLLGLLGIVIRQNCKEK